MKRLVGFTLALILCASCATSKKVIKVSAPVAAVPHKGAVLAGDYPDPSVIRVGNAYWAAATTSAWAPAFSLMRSEDLVNWQQVGTVFETKPQWSDGNYWAPELKQMDEKFYVYFAAKNKDSGRMCLGVATSRKVEGPYKDRGAMICQEAGSIDAAPVVDEKGQKWLFWKEDGNSMKKPTSIWLSMLSPDGTKLVGRMQETIRNDAPWEAQLVEGPYVMKHGAYWYMFYSGNACCTRTCNYAVGVARAKLLQGPWEKNPANPILKGNNDWKCPGHGTLVTTASGQDAYMYHAYNAQDSVYVGRQAMLDVVTWSADGWPSINNGMGPGVHAEGLWGISLKNSEHVFTDEFDGDELQASWQWPQNNSPRVKVADGKLLLSVTAGMGDPITTVVGRSTTTGNYKAVTRVFVKDMPSGSLAGLAAYGNEKNAIGLSIGDGRARLWQRKEGVQRELGMWDTPQGDELYVRMTAREGHLFQFEVSTDQRTWISTGAEVDGSYLPPWDLGTRIALTAGGPTGSEATFESFTVTSY